MTEQKNFGEETREKGREEGSLGESPSRQSFRDNCLSKVQGLLDMRGNMGQHFNSKERGGEQNEVRERGVSRTPMLFSARDLDWQLKTFNQREGENRPAGKRSFTIY